MAQVQPEVPAGMSSQRTQIPPTREETDDVQIGNIQRAARRIAVAVNQRGGPPVNIGPVVFTAGQKIALEHKLQRVPVECVAVDVRVGYGSFFTVSASETQIVIQSQNACTATFRIS